MSSLFSNIAIIFALLFKENQGQECDCFITELEQIYEYRPNSGIFCYQYIIIQDVTNPECLIATDVTLTFGIDETECFLNGLELADVMIDTIPDIWTFQEGDDANFPGVKFNINPIQPQSIIEMCIDGTRGFTAQSPLKLTIDNSIHCETNTFTENPDFCGLYILILAHVM